MVRRIQLTTDGHKMYLQAVEDGFGGEIDIVFHVVGGEGLFALGIETAAPPVPRRLAGPDPGGVLDGRIGGSGS